MGEADVEQQSMARRGRRAPGGAIFHGKVCLPASWTQGRAAAHSIRVAALRNGNEPDLMPRRLEKGNAPPSATGEPRRRDRLAQTFPSARLHYAAASREVGMTVPPT